MTKAKCEACGEPVPRHALLYRLRTGEEETTNTLLCPDPASEYVVYHRHDAWNVVELEVGD